MMTYEEVYDVLARYTNDVVQLFADQWSRWPAPETAQKITMRLDQLAGTYSSIGEHKLSALLLRAAEEIKKRAEQ